MKPNVDTTLEEHIKSSEYDQTFFGCGPHTQRCYHVRIMNSITACFPTLNSSCWSRNSKYVVEKHSGSNKHSLSFERELFASLRNKFPS